MNVAKAALAERQARFESEMEAHRGILFKVVGAFTWHPEESQDLAQEITVQLWRAFPKYDPRRTFSTWMYQVALNVAISWSRKSKIRSRYHAPAEALEEIPAPDSEGTDSQALYGLIDGLDELNRALLLLYLEERSHAEIGEILGISSANVATKINRLKHRLRLEVEAGT
ncbi:MAG: RNA polymerase sigma factor [Fimbriimonas sp.]